MTSARSQMRAYQLDQLGSLYGLVLVEREIPFPGSVLIYLPQAAFVMILDR
jgi:hypothetical protein